MIYGAAMGSETGGTPGEANPPFGQLVISTLYRLGVGHFIVSPGSRSTPLTLAVAGLPAGSHSVVLDERSAAFEALGRIKATGQPVAVVCTSGSAGAHYYPAVIEARESSLPLVVLTADRPPELRHCHAGQTIDQLKLFGTYPLFHAELPLPETGTLLLRQVREICRCAVESALGSPSGPVHLNCPFREPFSPSEGTVPDLDTALLDGLSPVRLVQAEPDLVPRLPERTLVLAGPRPGHDAPDELEAVLELGRRCGFPILADGCNPLRYRGDAAPVVVHYDRIARDDALWEELRPQAVVLWGEPPTSKLLRQRLADLDLPGYLVSAGQRNLNPVHGFIAWAGSSMARFLERCEGVPSAYGQEWLRADERMEATLISVLGRDHEFFEGDVHRFLSGTLPPGAPVFYASSLAIRDAEWFMPKSSSGLRPYCQRGANGIDGTLSLARGMANALGEPAWLVTGDLAFLHDKNGLEGRFVDGAGLFVVLINNSGGGIFEFLPVAGQGEAFETFFATPQGVDIKQLVRAHGGTHAACSDLDGLGEALRSWNGSGLVVAELHVDRKLSKVLHRKHLVLDLTSEE
jgi:2-succinyl-5-enolpyruvyl-6-hydroxy-3-cyclohexene-1-carboxylate synthase